MIKTNAIAIYVRVSSEEQVKSYSIDAQLDELRTYAAKHNLSIYHEYIDAGYSGKSIDGRPAMIELLSDAKQNRFSAIITWKLNRLARNLVDQLKILKVFEQRNIRYMSLTEQFDSSTPQGSFTLQMLGAIAQLEREQIAQNVRLGMQKRSQQGAWNSGNNVLGYEWIVGTDSEPHVKIVPHEATLVQMIFEYYRSGRGLKAITNQLNATGYMTKRNKSFSITAVRGIITNVNYIGRIQYTVHEKFNGASSDQSKRIVQGLHEPIISLELWNEVQELLHKRSRPPTKQVSRHYPLTGLLKCPLCGGSMIPAHTKAIRKNGSIHLNHYYVCGNYSNKGSAACKANAVPASSVENEALSRFQSMLMNKNLLEQIIVRVNRRNQETEKSLREQLAMIVVKLKQLEMQQRRCFELFEDGFIGQAELIEKSNAIKSDVTILNKNQREFESKLVELGSSVISLNEVRCAMRTFFQSFHAIDLEKRNTLLRGFIKSIIMPPDRDVAGIQINGVAAIKQLTI